MKGHHTGYDRWRTNAIEIGIGDFTIGSWIFTNDPAREGSGKYDYPTDRQSPIWGSNKRGYRAKKYTTWKSGQVFAAPLYLGYRYNNKISRFGLSEPWIQDFQQNGIHQSPFTPGNQNYYLDYDYFNRGIYMYGGFYNPHSLYGF